MTTRIPIEMIDIGQLPQERSITYDEICRIIGSLYLDSHRRMSILEEQLLIIKKDADSRLKDLLQENTNLKKELDKRNGMG